jgi:hypothetical protein
MRRWALSLSLTLLIISFSASAFQFIVHLLILSILNLDPEPCESEQPLSPRFSPSRFVYIAITASRSHAAILNSKDPGLS